MYVPYCCPRCDFTTNRKSRIYDHLFQRKKECPAVKEEIELTLDLKNYILENRVLLKPDYQNYVVNVHNSFYTQNVQVNNLNQHPPFIKKETFIF